MAKGKRVAAKHIVREENIKYTHALADVTVLIEENPNWLTTMRTQWDGDLRAFFHDLWKRRFADHYGDGDDG